LSTYGVRPLTHREKKLEEGNRNVCLIAYNNPQSAVAEHYRKLRNNIRFARDGQRIGRLAVTSLFDGDGKTMVAVNLAISLAQQGDRVLLVDANIGSPILSQVFNLKSWPGLSDILANQAECKEVIQSTWIENLSVIPGGSGIFNTADRLDSPVMNGLLESISADYDAILLDCSSVLVAADSVAIASKSDGVLLVVNKKARQQELTEARSKLEFANANLLGTVLNKAKVVI